MSNKSNTIMTTIISILDDLPDGYQVFFTGPNVGVINHIETLSKESGLTNVLFFTPGQIRSEILRGRKGVLLIDDPFYLTREEFDILRSEQKRLKSALPKNIMEKIFGEVE